MGVVEYEIEITRQEVVIAINKLTIRKSQGIDGILAELMKLVDVISD